MFPVTLTGDRVRLREFGNDDVNDALTIVGDNRVTDWLSFDAKSLDETAAMIEGIIDRTSASPRTEFYLAVTPVQDDRVVGFVRLGLAGVRAAKLGFAIAADHWGKGYATDAARTLTDFGFRELGLHRISAAVGPENLASAVIVTKLGLRPEGRIRDHVFTNGQWRDSLLFSVLEHEWNRQAT
ncbi:GNAT family N-acetyltransferase [Actinomadura sp. 6N118]|uniref:GNAT family N-acetyltransferase n=1 Tax=Actinomadura sp. 6N118 TaxID=3375151 RepID=UPI0037A74A99